MMESIWEDKSFRSAVLTECALAVFAAMAGLFQLWGVFAAMALTCILVPMWVMTIACVVSAVQGHSGEEDDG